MECVRTVELPPSSIQEEAPLVEESDIEETVLLMPQAQTVKFFEHRHLRLADGCVYLLCYVYTASLEIKAQLLSGSALSRQWDGYPTADAVAQCPTLSLIVNTWQLHVIGYLKPLDIR